MHIVRVYSGPVIMACNQWRQSKFILGGGGGQNFISRQIDIDSPTFHAVHVPMYLDLHKLLFHTAHK